jgi:hypothetical protein
MDSHFLPHLSQLKPHAYDYGNYTGIVNNSALPGMTVPTSFPTDLHRVRSLSYAPTSNANEPYSYNSSDEGDISERFSPAFYGSLGLPSSQHRDIMASTFVLTTIFSPCDLLAEQFLLGVSARFCGKPLVF